MRRSRVEGPAEGPVLPVPVSVPVGRWRGYLGLLH